MAAPTKASAAMSAPTKAAATMAPSATAPSRGYRH
jgi:hypothetical protein